MEKEAGKMWANCLLAYCCYYCLLTTALTLQTDADKREVWYASPDGSDTENCGEGPGVSACRTLQRVLSHTKDGGQVYLSTTRGWDETFLGCNNSRLFILKTVALQGYALRPTLGCTMRTATRFKVVFSTENQGRTKLVLRNLSFRNIHLILDGVNLELENCDFQNAELHLTNIRENPGSMDAKISRSIWRGIVDCLYEDSCQPSSAILVSGHLTSLEITDTMFLQHRINISLTCDSDLLFDNIHMSNSAEMKPMMGGLFIALFPSTTRSTVTLKDSVLENQHNWHPAASVMNLFMAAFLVRILGPHPRFVYPENNVTVVIENSRFYNNERALTFQGPIENILVVDSYFDSNIVMHGGGALLVLTESDKTIVMRNCTFRNNAAGHMRTDNVKPLDEEFILIGDEVQVNSRCCKGTISLVGKGGAARIQRGHVILENCFFYNNTAQVLGGTIFVDRQGTMDIRNSTFANTPDYDKASQQGDVIYSNGRVSINGGQFLVQSTSNHISLLQHSGQHWSISVYDVSIECPIGHRLRVMNTSAYKIEAELGLLRSYMLDQLSYFCESCPRQKYSTDRGLLSYKLDHGVYTYYTLMINGENPQTTFHGKYNYHDIQCKDCPYGANCDITLRAIPNFWGYELGDNITFQLCPKGYCCSKAPCETYNSCAMYRTGVLCGNCIQGYSEALFSAQCVPSDTCGPIWIWPFACATGILYALLLLFQKDIRDFIFTRPGACHEPAVEAHPDRGVDYHICSTRSTAQAPCCNQQYLPSDAEFATDYGCSKENVRASDSEGDRAKDTDDDSAQHLHAENSLTMCNGTKNKDGDTDTSQKPTTTKTDIGAILLIIVLYYFQDAMLFQVKTVFAEPETKTRSTLRAVLLGLFKFRLEVAHFVDNVCLLPGLSPSQKLLALTVLVPYVLLLFGFLYLVHAARTCTKRVTGRGEQVPEGKSTFLSRLSTGFMLALLFMYQRLATTAFTLLNCVDVGDHTILFIEGSVKCYEMWQYGVMAYALGSIVPFCAVLLLGPGFLREGKVGLPTFFIACLIPLPFVLYWAILRLCQKRKKKKKKKSSSRKEFVMSRQCQAVVAVLQGPFKDLNNRYFGPVCWAGVLIFRRLILILLYTFINHSLVRVISMMMTCFLILLHHVHVQPYKDNLVNIAGSASVSALMIVGGINLVRAGFETAEYIPQGPNEKLIRVMQETESILMLWFPLVIMSLILFVLLLQIIYALGKTLTSCSKH